MRKLLLILALLASACVQARQPDGKYVYRQGTGNDREYSLDVYLPDDDGKPRPVLILFHGGGWTSHDKGMFAAFASRITRFTRMVVISANYPLTGNPQDGVEAARGVHCWVRSHALEFRIDRDYIALGGASAGGQLAAAAGQVAKSNAPECDGLRVRKPGALVLLNPAVDLSAWSWYTPELSAVNPMEMVRDSLPATLLLNGTSDAITPVATARAFRAKALGAGAVMVKVVEYEGRPHSFWKEVQNGDLRRTVWQTVHFLSGLGWPIATRETTMEQDDGSR
jgi:acetyl esterase/lipase